MYIVYILISLIDLKFYIGYTTNLKERKKKHDNGGVPSTKNRRPLELIFHESYTNKYDALRREKYFKTTDGKRALKIMLRETLKKYKNQ